MAVEHTESDTRRQVGPAPQSRDELLRDAAPPDPQFGKWCIEGLTEQEESAFLAAIDAT